MYKNREVIDFLEDTLHAMERAELFIADITYEEFLKDEKTMVLPGIELVTSPYVKGRWGGVILFQVTRIPPLRLGMITPQFPSILI